MPSQNTFAAIDLGSNSFHMIIAREENGRLQILDRLRESVRLASGLNADGDIDEAIASLALETLQQFGQRLREFSSTHVRCVGTNTLRRVSPKAGFLKKAELALGHPIDIIAGREEARLIYLGTTHSTSPIEGNQLVIDIGGGSTELIIGAQGKPHTLESIHIGCVTYTKQFFPNGEITEAAFKKATTQARLQLASIGKPYRDIGWQHVLGCSGTIKAVEVIAQANGWTDAGITLDAIKNLKKALIDAGHIENIEIEALKDNRQPVIVGGTAVLEAIFNALKIENMDVSQSSLREGLLYDLIGRTHKEDIRDATVRAFSEQYNTNQTQNDRVKDTISKLFPQVTQTWELNDHDLQLLQWSASLVEIGLSVSHSKYHRHSEYLLKHADMPGFARQEQYILAALARLHRSKFNEHALESVSLEHVDKTFYLAVILRLAVLFNRSRLEEALPEVKITATSNSMSIELPQGWLAENPLTEADLARETEYYSATSRQFHFSAN